MTRLLGGAACLALSLLATPPALAGDTSTSYGECSFDTTNATQGDVWSGEVHAVVALYSPDHGNVVTATVTCDLKVNGVTQATSSAHGAGVVVLADRLTFTATDADLVSMCTTVDYTSDSTPTTVECQDPEVVQVPPHIWLDLIGTISSLLVTADPYTCAALGALAPGAGPVTVTTEGDVSYDGELYWDCPPYGSPQPPPLELPPLPVDPPPVPGGPPSGGGYNTGDAGFLALVSAERTVAAACGFAADPATGTAVVTGSTATAGAGSARIRCRLEDAATGTVLYDETASAAAPAAALHGTLAGVTGALTVCTEGAGVWGTQETTVGPHCRPATG